MRVCCTADVSKSSRHCPHVAGQVCSSALSTVWHVREESREVSCPCGVIFVLERDSQQVPRAVFQPVVHFAYDKRVMEMETGCD